MVNTSQRHKNTGKYLRLVNFIVPNTLWTLYLSVTNHVEQYNMFYGDQLGIFENVSIINVSTFRTYIKD